MVRIPEAITFDQAAAAMLKGLTVRYLLKDSFEVKSHHTVLFHAAAGGVGGAARTSSRSMPTLAGFEHFYGRALRHRLV